MAEWELNPYDNFPQTPEVYREQIEQELQACMEKQRFLLEEWVRVNHEMMRLEEVKNEDT